MAFTFASLTVANVMARGLSLGATVALAVLLVPACATPTALTLSVYSELECDKGSVIAVVGGSALDTLPSKAPSSVSTTCDATGRRGSVVVLPTASKDEWLGLAVMQRADGQPADGCLDARQSARCIVAKRQFRFTKHNTTDMRVDLRLSCLGISCKPDETCFRGACVEALTACVGACDETSLGSAFSGPEAPISSTPDASASAGSPAGTGDNKSGGVSDSGVVEPSFDFVCPQGGCTQTCIAGPICRASCGGGGCTQTCTTGISCDFSCDGGSCTQVCPRKAACTLTCGPRRIPGGSCFQG